MNTIVEFALVTIGVLMLLLVPVALIAGGLACRSVVISSDLGDNHSEADEANQNPVPVSTAHSNEQPITVASTSASRR
jgi:flagellar basal body-associated protein FliL